MTRFEKQYMSIQQDPFEAREILESRQKEIKDLKEKRNDCKNKFRWQCLTQEIDKLEREYQTLDNLI